MRSSALRFIVALGIVSMLADVTYEGARSINGPFLATLGASAAVVGIVSGAGEFAGYVLRLASGFAVDRRHAYWAFTIAGYVLTLAAVPLMAFSHHWTLAAALIIAERTGKAIRAPARDTLLSQAAHVVGRGWGFGLHGFLDQTGAVIGPLAVALAIAGSHYARGYAMLGIASVLAIVVLTAAVRLFPNPSHFEPALAPATPQPAPLPRSFWIFIAASSLVAAGFVDFPLIAFHFQKTALVQPAMIPIFYSVAMGAEALTALAFGRLFDRIGIGSLIAGILLSAVSSPLVFLGSQYAALAGMALWGAGMGAQHAPMRAQIAMLSPPARRATAYGIFNTAYGLLWFAGSAAIGILYARSLAAVVALAMLAQLASIPLFALAGRKTA
jgi:predicted MFS family arabinose efflux permease